MISTITKLEDLEIEQGGSVIIELEYEDIILNNSFATDISSYAPIFVLCPYGQEDYIQLQKQASFLQGSNSIVSVTLTTTETNLLQGAYTMEFFLKDTNNELIKNARGVLHVLKSPTIIV